MRHSTIHPTRFFKRRLCAHFANWVLCVIPRRCPHLLTQLVEDFLRLVLVAVEALLDHIEVVISAASRNETKTVRSTCPCREPADASPRTHSCTGTGDSR